MAKFRWKSIQAERLPDLPDPLNRLIRFKYHKSSSDVSDRKGHIVDVDDTSVRIDTSGGLKRFLFEKMTDVEFV